MQVPKKPPSVDQLLNELPMGADAGALWDRLQCVPTDTRYLHWDKLRHVSAPDGWTHEEWWLGLKLARLGQARPIPLQDTDGRAFSYTLSDPIPQWLHDIDFRTGGMIKMADPILNPDTKDQYLVRSLVDEAITSSQLEGAATTRRVARDMIRTGRRPRDRSERMILNNYITMRDIVDVKEERLTPELVLRLHRQVTKGTLDRDDAPGRLRNSDERIDIGDDYGNVFHIPPPAEQLPGRLQAMCDFANGETPEGFVHPAVRSIVLHFWLAYDHPFVDGNGRTARALFYWCMLHNRYWLCEYISISEIINKAPSKYGRAFLYTETDDNDLTYFLLYHLEVIRRAVDQLHAYVERKTSELRLLERHMRAIAHLNHRQQSVISHALRHPHYEYSLEGHRHSHNIAYETARSDLLDLDRRGLLDGRKVGRQWRFVPAPDLERKLRDS